MKDFKPGRTHNKIWVMEWITLLSYGWERSKLESGHRKILGQPRLAITRAIPAQQLENRNWKKGAATDFSP